MVGAVDVAVLVEVIIRKFLFEIVTVAVVVSWFLSELGKLVVLVVILVGVLLSLVVVVVVVVAVLVEVTGAVVEVVVEVRQQAMVLLQVEGEAMAIVGVVVDRDVLFQLWLLERGGGTFVVLAVVWLLPNGWVDSVNLCGDVGGGGRDVCGVIGTVSVCRESTHFTTLPGADLVC